MNKVKRWILSSTTLVSRMLFQSRVSQMGTPPSTHRLLPSNTRKGTSRTSPTQIIRWRQNTSRLGKDSMTTTLSHRSLRNTCLLRKASEIIRREGLEYEEKHRDEAGVRLGDCSLLITFKSFFVMYLKHTSAKIHETAGRAGSELSCFSCMMATNTLRFAHARDIF